MPEHTEIHRPTSAVPLPSEMLAVEAFGGAAADPSSLREVALPIPSPTGVDILVEVHAVSVNPVDVKVRAGIAPKHSQVLGYDAVGVVRALGESSRRFSVGDRVFYAGQIDRPGTNSQFHIVNENIVGHAPARLSDAEAAAIPLTAITAWESLFDRLRLTLTSRGTLLVIGAAGGVGSLVIQLAKARTGLEVIAVASRPESISWVQEMGADHVVGRDFMPEVQQIAPDGVDYIFTAYTPGNMEAMASVITPHGEIVSIDESGGGIDALKSKSVTWHWELMFTRPMFEPKDASQHELLNEVARMLDAGELRTTMTKHLRPFSSTTLRKAHEIVETSATIGKVVVSGFPLQENDVRSVDDQ